MVTVIIQINCILSFLIVSIILGRRLKKNPEKETAQKSSKVVHLFFQLGLIFPIVLGLVTPGMANFDGILGIRPLPFELVAYILGIIFFIAGCYLNVVSIIALKLDGLGLPGFNISSFVVKGEIYKKTRNPMSLGLYLICISLGLMTGSTYVTLTSLFLIVPSHIIHLKLFEEIELEIRYGKTYVPYKKSTPFMIPKMSLQED